MYFLALSSERVYKTPIAMGIPGTQIQESLEKWLSLALDRKYAR